MTRGPEDIRVRMHVEVPPSVAMAGQTAVQAMLRRTAMQQEAILGRQVQTIAGRDPRTGRFSGGPQGIFVSPGRQFTMGAPSSYGGLIDVGPAGQIGARSVWTPPINLAGAYSTGPAGGAYGGFPIGTASQFAPTGPASRWRYNPPGPASPWNVPGPATPWQYNPPGWSTPWQPTLRNRVGRMISDTPGRLTDAARGFMGDRGFANIMMGGMTPAMMGLLGPAGFPFLNIGFAAMSGGPTGAGIAGMATALGQATMAINRFSETAIQQAENLNTLSLDFRRMRAEREAITAGAGAIIASQQVPFGRMANQAYQRALPELIGLSTFVGAGRNAATMAGAAGIRALGGGTAQGTIRGLGNLGRATGLGGIATLLENLALSQTPAIPAQAEDALNRYMRSIAPRMRVEDDPRAVWRRIQEGFDPKTEETRKVQLEQIEALRENTQVLREANERGRETPQSFMEKIGDVGGEFLARYYYDMWGE